MSLAASAPTWVPARDAGSVGSPTVSGPRASSGTKPFHAAAARRRPDQSPYINGLVSSAMSPPLLRSFEDVVKRSAAPRKPLMVCRGAADRAPARLGGIPAAKERPADPPDFRLSHFARSSATILALLMRCRIEIADFLVQPRQ